MSEVIRSAAPRASSALQPESVKGTEHTPTLAEWSEELGKAGFARPVAEYLKPSTKLTQTRQGSIYWNDNGDCLAVDEDAGKALVPYWPDHAGWRGRIRNVRYGSPDYRVIPGQSTHEMTLVPTNADANPSFHTTFGPLPNRITQITVHLTTAARSTWEQGDKVWKPFSPEDDGVRMRLSVEDLPRYQYASSGLLVFELDDLSGASE